MRSFLPAGMRSLQSQTMGDWELIAVDDGSTDDSVKILSETGDPRIRVSQNETNLGTYGNLYRALSMASSDLIAVLNSDDEWAPTKLELQLNALEKHPEAQICYTDGLAIGNTSRLGDVQGEWPRDEVQELLPYLLQENRVLASSVIFRKPFVSFDPSMRYSGDWEALLRPVRNAPVAFVDTPLTKWRIHDRNTFVRSKGQVAEEIRLRQSIPFGSGLLEETLACRRRQSRTDFPSAPCISARFTFWKVAWGKRESRPELRFRFESRRRR